MKDVIIWEEVKIQCRKRLILIFLTTTTTSVFVYSIKSLITERRDSCHLNKNAFNKVLDLLKEMPGCRAVVADCSTDCDGQYQNCDPRSYCTRVWKSAEHREYNPIDEVRQHSPDR